MEFGLLGFLNLMGSLGFFIYGMKVMSEGIQKVAGTKMRQILRSMTSNRFKGVLTGFALTALVQSSSATTVLVVSFVNAGSACAGRIDWGDNGSQHWDNYYRMVDLHHWFQS
jgi:phosphate:Na+ symporter